MHGSAIETASKQSTQPSTPLLVDEKSITPSQLPSVWEHPEQLNSEKALRRTAIKVLSENPGLMELYFTLDSKDKGKAYQHARDLLSSRKMGNCYPGLLVRLSDTCFASAAIGCYLQVWDPIKVDDPTPLQCESKDPDERFSNCSALIALSNNYILGNFKKNHPPYDNFLEVWDVEMKHRSRHLPRPDVCIDALLPLSGGRFVEAQFRNPTNGGKIISYLYFTSATDCKTILKFGSEQRIRSLGRFSDDEIIIGSNDNSLCLYNIQQGQITKTLEGHKSPATAIAVSKSGLIISGSEKGSLRIWDAKTGFKYQIKAHSRLLGSNPVNAIICTDDNRIISASDDETVQIWDLDKDGAHIATLKHQSPVKSVILQNGKIITSAADGSIQSWHDYVVKSIKVDLQFKSKLASAKAQVTVVNNQLVISTQKPCEKELKDCSAALLALCPDHPQLTVTLTPNKLTIGNILDDDLPADLLDLCVTFGVHKQEQLKSNSFNGAVHLSISNSSSSSTTSTPLTSNPHVADGVASQSQCTPYS